MKKSNPSVYPITAGFEEQLKLMQIMSESPSGEIFWELGLMPRPDAPKNFNQIQDVAKTMHETLGEYEHGTAEPQELMGDFKLRFTSQDEEHNITEFRKQSLITLRNIYIDLLLTMGSK